MTSLLIWTCLRPARLKFFATAARRAERGEVSGIELIDVDRRVDGPAEREVIAARAAIADGDRHVARQFALQIDRVFGEPDRAVRSRARRGVVPRGAPEGRECQTALS